ncbi:GNAT family N-acetyltransferase [Lysinibacillus irui]|uniref:GNAT family N-acetyltransferase n=1 Tax=Lysinibacillus irui TaxID=2998077 RepID=A0ABU5NHS4_9BACI|nr:GNAT family N-acetyltransferase [Lysinibacillus irui]MEA0553005.1 GNAT family N-acetyltransferase [Lysinibacillus irui]MEA0975585.1 GNAT family N-acetyltransferase [Lysinibacillus irui]MEA1041739.1 GNAT family N-acetyltransferase [Lysinibacillus irui]
MQYKYNLDDISSDMLRGFFVDWPNPPSSQTHLKLLENSSNVVIAVDEQSKQVVGFITAISDGVLSAYIPFLEVLPAYKNRGIGKELIKRMLDELSNIYMIDLCCDDDLIPLYEKFGMIRSNGMLMRNYKMQSGIPNE